jgi:Fe-Mn family superoxide dismutase
MLRRRDFLALTGWSGAALFLGRPAFASPNKLKQEDKIMAYTAKDYSKLIGMAGFSETLLKNHFTLYQGYVTNTNKVLDTLAGMLKEGKTGVRRAEETPGLGVQRHAAP